MPDLHKLEAKLDPSIFIVFSLSIDDDYKAWKRASDMENLNDKRHNYLVANWKESSFSKAFSISSIPRYLLYAPDGQLITDNAPRPSDPELIEVIKKNLLK